MIGTRSNCADWVRSTKPADGALLRTPIPAIWTAIKKDWPEQCQWFSGALPRNRHLDWFLHGGDTGFETWIMRSLPPTNHCGGDLRRDLEDLVRSKAGPDDPRWLDLFARSQRFGQIVAAAEPIWLNELREGLLNGAAELVRSRTASDDPRWIALRRLAVACSRDLPIAHDGSLTALGEAIGPLESALSGRFTDGDALRKQLSERLPKWRGVVAGVLDDDPGSVERVPTMIQEVLQFRRALLSSVSGMDAFLSEWSSVDLEREWDMQYLAIARDLANRAIFDKVAAEAFRREALVLPDDRDPADVVLRRVSALLAELERGRARLPALKSALETLRRSGTSISPDNIDGRYVLYAEACRLRRQIALANPLLNFNDLVFIKRHPAIYNHMCDQYYGITARPGGALCILRDAFKPGSRVIDVLENATVAGGRLRGTRLVGGPGGEWDLRFDGLGNLTGDETEGGSFLSPDISFDGKQIVFAYVECRGERGHREHTDASRGHWDEGRCYHIFRVNADGSGLVQLTDGTWNDFDPCFMPDGRIAFTSERRGGYLCCGRICPTYTLHDMAADGGDIRCLSPHETNEWHPSVSHDGLIVWTRWDYVDRHGVVAHMPWTTTPGGRDPRAVHGNYSFRAKRPDMELDVRAIPGSRLFVATAAPHHGQSFGSLVIIDPRAADDDAMGPVRRLTPEIAFPESQGGTVAYGEAWPLGENYHLCVYDAFAGTQASGGPTGKGLYGIYLLDCFGNKELIYRDPAIGCHNPMPLAPRPRPPIVHEPSNRIASDDGAEGIMAVLDVYNSQKPWPEGTKIKAIRVYQVLPQTLGSVALPHATGVQIPFTLSVNVARKVLGTAPVETDGSAHFIVPAGKELFFQALGEDGLAVQSMRSATHLQPGETRTCHGCHEPRGRAPAPPKGMPLALLRPPSRLRPDVDGTNPFSFPRLVQPVLDKHCVACHQQNPDKAPRLDASLVEVKRGQWWADGTYYASYISLTEKYGFYDYGGHDFGDERAYRTTPGQFGARASKLYPMLLKGHHDVKLSPDELHRIAVWLDSTSPFYGVYEKEGGLAQLRGEIARPSLE